MKLSESQETCTVTGVFSCQVSPRPQGLLAGSVHSSEGLACCESVYLLKTGCLIYFGNIFFPFPTEIGTCTPLTSEYSISAHGSKVL